MAEFRGKNQPTAVLLLLLTGHRPPTRQGLLPSLFGGYSGTPGETETGDKCGSALMASAKHLPWYGKDKWKGQPIRSRKPIPSLSRGRA